jgi:DNA-binding transcriptional ArsR family regulator
VARVAQPEVARRAASARTTLPALVDAVKALAHPGRLRMLAMLRGGDLCVCQMTAALERAASTVSSHLGDLRRAGLVTERKDGKWVHYHLVDTGPLADLVDRTLRLAAGDDRLRQDARVVEDLRRVPLETLCRAGFDLQASGVRPAPTQTRPRRNRTATRRSS